MKIWITVTAVCISDFLMCIRGAGTCTVHTWGRYMNCAYVGQVHELCVRGAGTCTVRTWGRYMYRAYVGQVHVLCVRGAGTCRCRMALESLIHGARNL